MNAENINRRQFLTAASAGTVAAVTSTILPASGAKGKKSGFRLLQCGENFDIIVELEYFVV